MGGVYVIEPLQKGGVRQLKIGQGILDEVRIHKQTSQAYKTMIKVEIKLLQVWFNEYKMEKHKMLKKIEHFNGSIYLDVIRAFTSP
jgi:hypothetical protein